MKLKAETVEQKNKISGDDLGKLSQLMTRLTEKADLTLAETTKTVGSMTAVMELVRSQAAHGKNGRRSQGIGGHGAKTGRIGQNI
ncbi:hypothetical protein JKG47_17425 [Acidithiobacillus sp. MC6.1]|nr:hypothetical protein [Acidithiobacillus sp. MC6.1]